jgi:hypothetical protein
MTASPVFAQRTVAWLLAVGGLSFAAAMLLIVFGDELLPTSTAGANAYSESAIGHKAFAETLQQLGIPVLVSRNDSLERAGPRDLLVVAEPPVQQAEDAYLQDLVDGDRVLLVLPKWLAVPDQVNRRWAGRVMRIPPAGSQDILRIVARGAAVESVEPRPAWRANRFGRQPTLAQPQLMTTDRLTPLIDSDRGMLLGEATEGYGRVWVLSDPDLISNHGLRQGDNAVIAVGIIQALLPPGGTVIIDEVIHGFRRDPNVWRALFEFPIIIITINALIAAAVLIWAASGRFGSPVRAEPPLKAGKTTLVENAAGLLRFGGHAGEILGRYLAVTFGDVARRVHAPGQLGDTALDQWLERVGKARQVRATPAALRREAELATVPGRADDRRLLHVAHELYRWKQEMLDGPGDDSFGQRAAEGAGTQGRRRPGRGH